MRRWRAWLIPLAGLVGIGLAIALSTSGSGRSATKIDGQDPYRSGCLSTSEIVPGTKEPIDGPSGSWRGEVLLHRSRACHTIWGYVKGLEGYGRYRVEIDLHRPSDHKELLFHDADTKSDIFGNMLSERPGCVYATAYVEVNKQRGPTARTPCR
jgi:hypothetical protein